jgi:hypothetical protein
MAIRQRTNDPETLMSGKQKHRLYLDEITSVGACRDGDNPESEIIFFYKSKDAGQGELWRNTSSVVTDPAPAVAQSVLQAAQQEIRNIHLTSLENQIMSKEPAETVANRIEKTLNTWALWKSVELMGTERGLTKEVIKSQFWLSEAGNDLAALLRDQGSEAFTTIKKSGDHKAGWQALERLR